jgi:hypothetical protein
VKDGVIVEFLSGQKNEIIDCDRCFIGKKRYDNITLIGLDGRAVFFLEV